MTPISKQNRPTFSRAFTLLELLVVLAILAVIATGIATTYGRKNIDESKDKMSLHEMREIKTAFLQFEIDNCQRLRQEFADHTGTELPTAAFEGGFESGHVDNDDLEGLMEFYETYGLWFLLQQKISKVPAAALDLDGDYAFPIFADYDGLSSEGWNGPYIDAILREAWTFSGPGLPADGLHFPQIANKHGGVTITDANLVKPLGVYRLLYYEHCEDVADVTETIYRRLLLVAPRGDVDWDELTDDELLLETGNLRGGSDEGRLNRSTGSFTNTDNDPFFILELKNLDILPE